MDVVKKYLFAIVLGTLTLITCVAGGIVVYNFQSEASKYEQKVKDIQQSLKDFRSFRWALVQQNVEKAKENRDGTEKEFNALLKKLEELSAPTMSDDERENWSPLRTKNRIKENCVRFENMLRGENIHLPESLAMFSFDKYNDPKTLPKKDDIPQIIKQLNIIEDLIYLISRSEVTSLDRFERKDGLKVTKRDLYDYMPFGITLTGSVGSIRSFLNNLVSWNEEDGARYFYLVRNLTVEAKSERTFSNPYHTAASSSSPDEGKSSAFGEMGAPSTGGRSRWGRRRSSSRRRPQRRTSAKTNATTASTKNESVPLTKDERLLVTKPTLVTARIELDYVEFHKKD